MCVCACVNTYVSPTTFLPISHQSGIRRRTQQEGREGRTKTSRIGGLGPLLGDQHLVDPALVAGALRLDIAVFFVAQAHQRVTPRHLDDRRRAVFRALGQVDVVHLGHCYVPGVKDIAGLGQRALLLHVRHALAAFHDQKAVGFLHHNTEQTPRRAELALLELAEGLLPWFYYGEGAVGGTHDRRSSWAVAEAGAGLTTKRARRPQMEAWIGRRKRISRVGEWGAIQFASGAGADIAAVQKTLKEACFEALASAFGASGLCL